MPRVIVSGAIANKYLNGGEAWVRLSWVLGLKRLGCDVFFLEQIAPENCIDAEGELASFESCVNLDYFKTVMAEFGLAGSSALLHENGEEISGVTHEELVDVAETADLLVNISGHLRIESHLDRIGRKAYVDLDPGFTQFWHAFGIVGAPVMGHDYYFTVGENIGRPGCGIPTGGIRWRPIPPPVVLDEWPVVQDGEANRFTTVASWRNPYGAIEHGGKTFGLKVHEFRKIMDLPKRVSSAFEIALDIHPGDAKDLEALRAHGWRIVDPKVAVPDPATFRDYVQTSDAEFSVAQGIYVETGSGWFSDRTARYLASGKPALVQDTGFSRNYPVGSGLVAFRTLEEAVEGADRIMDDYDIHSRAARALAEGYFDSDQVLGRFLVEVGLAS
jgi:hypothetical protein